MCIQIQNGGQLGKKFTGEETISILNRGFGLKMLVFHYVTKRQMKDALSKVMSVAKKR